jgi:cardiolipin synthase A/B
MPPELPEFLLFDLDVGRILWTLYFVYMITASIYIISENRPPSITMAWILSFLALPVIGVLIYIFFGRTVSFFQPRVRLLEQNTDTELLRRLRPLLARQKELAATIGRDAISHDVNRKEAQQRLVEMGRRTGLSILTAGDQVEILQDAATKYPKLEADIEAAQSSIHMEYFIWQADEYMQRFGDLIIRKAQAGVEVRVLFDALGSHFLLWKNRRYLNRLRRGGVKIYPYLNFLGLWRLHTINYRNHRKIAVIDGKIGYTGGMNMGQEHLVGAKPYNGWRDTHLRLTGDTVAILQGIFATSWYNTTKEELTDLRYFPEAEPLPQKPIPVQIVLSGPDSQWHAIQQQYFLMILSAQEHVYIQSPFFIPNSSMSEAIRVAALSGVEVKLMFAPRDTGSPVANWAANTYFLDMVEARAKVYLYKPAYMHAKTLSIDSSVCSIGTANMDIRSFNINYEMNAILYDEEKTRELEAAFEHDLEGCELFDAKAYRAKSPLIRFRDSLARLLSPLL